MNKMEAIPTILWHGVTYYQQNDFWVSEDECRVMFNGYIYRWDGSYYRRGGTKGANPHSALHRAVWAFHKGEIPKDYHVHHIDHDPTNNSIDNLELHHKSEHSKYHGRTSSWVGSDENIKQLRKCNDRAKAWHQSEEGKQWHSLHGKQSWDARKGASKKCIVCAEVYSTYFPDRAKYCSDKCKRKFYRKNSKKENRICIICKKPFEINIYSTTKTCDKPCARLLSNHTKRESNLQIENVKEDLT